MKLNLNLLNQIVDISKLKTNDIVNKLTFSGFEVEEIQTIVDSDQLIIGEITDFYIDKNNSKIFVCNVNIKTKSLSIVTGAWNVKKGMKVVVAVDGTNIGSINKKIITSEFYGHKSEGMMLGYSELGISKTYFNDEENFNLIELSKDAKIGDDAINFLNLSKPILEISITPNRIDCYNYFNFANEFCALFNVKLKNNFLNKISFSPSIKNDLIINLLTKDCDLYSLSKINNVKITNSPMWIRLILAIHGINSINNLVDAGNLTALLLNQPVHVFDANLIDSKTFDICTMKNSKINLLNNQELKLNDEIVIVNNKKPLVIAGIIGGKDNSVNQNTKSIILEIASFNRTKIRKTQNALNIITDSSTRFSRGIDLISKQFVYEIFLNILNETNKKFEYSKLIEKKQKNESKPKLIEINFEYIKNYSSIDNLKQFEVLDIFKKLNFKCNEVNGNIIVEIPTQRKDIEFKQDLVEEIVRFIGYDRVNSKLPMIEINQKKQLNLKYKYLNTIKSFLVANGFYETITYSLINVKNANDFVFFDKIGGFWKLKNPISNNHEIMRNSLIPSMLETIKYNVNKQYKNVNIFEISKLYFKKSNYHILSIASNVNESNNLNSGFFSIKSLINSIFEISKFDLQNIFYEKSDTIIDLHPGKSAIIKYNNEILGYFGEVHPIKLEKYKLKNVTWVCELNIELLFNNFISKKIIAKDISIYPKTSRDLSFIFQESIPFINIKKIINNCKIDDLKKIDLIDIYEGNQIEIDKKSITLRFEFQNLNKTLKDNVVNEYIDKIKNEIATNINVEFRD